MRQIKNKKKQDNKSLPRSIALPYLHITNQAFSTEATPELCHSSPFSVTNVSRDWQPFFWINVILCWSISFSLLQIIMVCTVNVPKLFWHFNSTNSSICISNYFMCCIQTELRHALPWAQKYTWNICLLRLIFAAGHSSKRLKTAVEI